MIVEFAICKLLIFYFASVAEQSGLEYIKLLSFITQPSMKYQLLIKAYMLRKKYFIAFKLSDVVFTMLINVKISTIFAIYEHDK